MKEIDDELLQDLIDKCEAAMSRPFKKAKAPAKEEEPEEENEPNEEEKDEFEGLDIEELIKAYESRK